MSRTESLHPIRTILGWALIVLGVGVFAIRLQHEGAYAVPRGGNLFGGLGSLLAGGALLWARLPRLGVFVAMAFVPLVLFRGLYAIASESEEVISLYATHESGRAAELRLWITDREDGAWLGMPRTKATEHALDGAPHTMLRRGERVCVLPTLVEDRSLVRSMHAEKIEKYAVARIASAVGLYPSVAPDTTVAIRVDPCPPGAKVP